MKKIISIFIMLLLLTVVLVGCNDDVESNKKQENETTVEVSPQDNNTEAVEENNNENEITEGDVNSNQVNEQPAVVETLEPPEVYKKVNELNYHAKYSGKRKEFIEGSRRVSAYEINHEDVIYFEEEVHLFISFKTEVSTDTIDKIKFKSDNVIVKKKFWASEKSIGIVLDNKKYEPFSLIIESGIKDRSGRELKGDYIIYLQKAEFTTAKVNLIADTGTYNSSSFFELTDSPKVFEVNFSYPVNRESVEKTLNEDIAGNTKMEYVWTDDSHLTIKMKNLEYGKHFLTLDNAVSKDGIPIKDELFGLIQFQARPQTRIYSLDLEKGDSIQEAGLNISKDIYWMDPIYIPNNNLLKFRYTSYTSKEYVGLGNIYYDLSKNKVFEFTQNSNLEDITFEEVFNSDDYLLIGGFIYSNNGEQRTLTYNGKTYRELESIDKDNGILVFYLSNYVNSITIYDRNKDIIKDIPINIGNVLLEEEEVPKKYILLNNGRTIIVEGLDPEEADPYFNYSELNLYRIDIETGEVKLLKEHAQSPYFITKDTFLYRNSDGNLKISDLNGNIIEELPSGFSNYIDGNIVSSTSDSITIYNLKTKEKRIIPTDRDYQIIGGNESKIYFTK